MQHVDKGQFGYAAALSVILMVIVFVVVGIMNLILSRMGHSTSSKNLVQ